MVSNIRSSINPFCPGKSEVFYRSGVPSDPAISLTFYDLDMLYFENSDILWPIMR